MAPLEFRPLTTVDDWAEYLRLRQARWQSRPGLELNAHDRWARVLGLFDERGLLAALRLVFPRSDSPQLAQLRSAVEQLQPDALGLLEEAPEWRISLEKSLGAHGLTWRLDALESAGYAYCEAGRFVSAHERLRVDTTFRLMPWVVRWSVGTGCRHVFAAVRTGDVRRWGRYGFEAIAGLPVVEEPDLKIPVVACQADWGALAEHWQAGAEIA